MGKNLLLALFFIFSHFSLMTTSPSKLQAGYYVATTGSDVTGTGTSANPWATITHAITRVPDGSTILVKPGLYIGRVRLSGRFILGVTIRSEVPYQARLQNSADKVLTTYDGVSGVTLEGFDIAHNGAPAAAVVVHIDGGAVPGGAAQGTHHLTLVNNIFHDSYNNDILKINNGAEYITVRGNMFYNQGDSDEHIDVNSVKHVVIEDNIFFNDYAGSGRPYSAGSSAFIVVKDSNSDDDWVLGSDDITIRRNVFLNWQGSDGYGFLQLGEDGTTNYEAMNVLIENNLMLGNSDTYMRSPLGMMGVRDIVFRNNTIAGNLPSNAFAMRLYTYGANPLNQNIQFYNNIWSDPTGTLTDFSDSTIGSTTSYTLLHNLYWNNGAAIPVNAVNDLVNYTDDSQPLLADPLLTAQTGLVVPYWNGTTLQFNDGSATIRQAFLRLVNTYGVPGITSLAIDGADPAHAPADDILGNIREAALPDYGAVEVMKAFHFIPLIIR